jgi:hypothetical protein
MISEIPTAKAYPKVIARLFVITTVPLILEGLNSDR